jgi:peptidyl-prolyl cis-trans isomerase B (cyclophilin B)
MRSWARQLPVVVLGALVVLLVSFSAGCGGGQKAEKTAARAGESVEGTQASQQDTTAPATGALSGEETSSVTATLTYIENGAKKTKEVPYLPLGRKVATMETSKGVVKIELWEDKAPNTIVNFVSLANAGRYDGVDFHRVIAGFMAQTGDVEKKGGYGGPGYTIPAEFDALLKHTRGVVSMARSNDPDSAGSQFFIMLDASPHLDGKYTAFGKVIEGMEVVDALKKGDSAKNGSVENPDKIVKVRVESVPAQ